MKQKTLILIALACATLVTKIFSQPKWQQYGDLYGGMCVDMETVNGNLFAAFQMNSAYGGVWMTQNNGQLWTNITNGLNSNYVRDIANWNNTLVVCTSDTFYYSNNNGTTWTAINNGFPLYKGIVTFCVHNNMLFANAYDGSGMSEIWQLSSLGGTWTNTGFSLFSTNYNVFKVVSIDNGLYALSNWASCIMKSTDDGASWNTASAGLGFNTMALDLVGRGDSLYTSTGNDIYNSWDGGQSWTPASGGLFGNKQVYSFILDGNTLYAPITNDQLYSLPFGGYTWSNTFATGLPQKLYSRANIKHNGELYIGLFEGIYKSSGAINNFIRSSNGITNCIIQKIYKRNTDFLASLSSLAGIYASTNNGINFTATNNSNNDVVLDFSYFNGNYIGGGFGTLYTSTNANGPYTQSFTMTQGITRKFLATSTELYMSTNNGLWKTTDLQTWTNANNGLPPNQDYYDLQSNGNNWYTTAAGNNYYSNNGGTSWISDNVGINNLGNQRSFVMQGNRVWVHDDNFMFTKLIGDTGWTMLNTVPASLRNVKAWGANLINASYAGVYISADEGMTWQNFNEGFKNDLGDVVDIILDNNKIYAATQGSSMWARDLVAPINNVQAASMFVCAGENTGVVFNTSGTFLPGNTFYALLSDTAGFFANPDTIGFINDTTGGLIPCSIPNNILSGNHYRVKVISTMPPSLTEKNGVDVTIFSKPKIQLNPANQKACENENTGVYCYATGSGLIYTWQADTGNGWFTLLADAHHANVSNALMYLVNVQTNMNGNKYRCIVSGTCTPNDTSNTATLTVSNNYVTVITQPIDKAVCQYDAAVFNTVVQGQASYQWQVDIGNGIFTNLTNNSTYSGVTTNTLTVSNILLNMSNYKYRCKLSECSYTDEALLTVFTGLAILSHPQDIYTCGIATDVMGVTAVGSAVMYQWEVDSLNGNGFQPLFTNAVYYGVNTQYLQISNSGASMNNFIFRCALTNACNSNLDYSNQAVLHYTTSTAITQQPTNGVACEGTDLQFVCSAAGTTSYQWYIQLGNGWQPMLNNVNIGGAQSDTLTLFNTQLTYNGYYVRCLIGGCQWSDSVAITIHSLPTVSYASQGVYCTNSAPVTLSGGLPLGGIYSGSGINNGIFSPSIAGAGVHTISYTYTNANGCSNIATSTVVVDGCTSVADGNEGTDGVVLFPNPSYTGTVNLQVPSQFIGSTANVYDGIGRLYSSMNVNATTIAIELTNLSPGIYHVVLYSNNKKLVLRGIKN